MSQSLPVAGACDPNASLGMERKFLMHEAPRAVSGFRISLGIYDYRRHVFRGKLSNLVSA